MDTSEDSNGKPGDAYANHLAVDSSGYKLAGNLALPAGITMIFAVVYPALQAYRVGLISRLLSTLGAIAAATLILLPLAPALIGLWVSWLGLTYLGRVPNGRAPAWDAGVAIPWPRPGQPAPDDSAIEGTRPRGRSRRPARNRTRRVSVASAASARAAASRPAILFDSDCGFCRWTLGWVLRWDRARRLRPVEIQAPEGAGPAGTRRPGRAPALLAPGRGHRRGALGGRGLSRALLRSSRELRRSARLARRAPGHPARLRARRGNRSTLGRLVTAGAKRRADALIAARARRASYSA